MCPECRNDEPLCTCEWAEGEDFDEADDDDSGDCYWCCGDGWVECDDPLECTKRHQVYETEDGYVGQECRCSSCGGSGRAEDMTIW